jgi:hypothetical protein
MRKSHHPDKTGWAQYVLLSLLSKIMSTVNI